MQSISDRVSSFGPLELIGYIILNNARASFLAIALGFLAGIFPVLVVITNGYLLGFVARYTVNQQGALVLWKLLPHGVFELPAVIMSAGVGIYLGMNLVSGKKNLGKDFIDSIRFFIFIVIPLLIIAGIIEGTLIHLLKG
jgi:stage II sporulation protein M